MPGRPRHHQQLAALLAETRLLVRRNRRKVDSHLLAEIAALQGEAANALAAGDEIRIGRATAALQGAAARHLEPLRRSFAREALEMVVVAILLAAAMRLFVVEAWRIPSGSMVPTLLPGDVVLVSRSAYGVRLPGGRELIPGPTPARGDVIVFTDPQRPEQNLIKRVAGLPGDEIELIDEQVHLNRSPQQRQLVSERYDYWNFREELGYWHPQSGNLYLEQLEGRRYATVHSRLLPRPRPDEGPFVVPAGHLFVLGDNRDESADGRSDGGWYVPFEAVKGRAWLVALSWGRGGAWAAQGESGLRVRRLLRSIDGSVSQQAELPMDEAAAALAASLDAAGPIHELPIQVPPPPPPPAEPTQDGGAGQGEVDPATEI